METKSNKDGILVTKREGREGAFFSFQYAVGESFEDSRGNLYTIGRGGAVQSFKRHQKKLKKQK